MAQPVWVTPAGNLGTIPEGVFYQIPLQAYDPTDPNNPNAVYYTLIAGALPSGVQCSKTGLIVGVPKAVASVQGVPSPVSRNVTSKFTVRVYTEKVISGVTVIDRLVDRTFELTVTGENPPQFVTPAGLISTVYDGSAFSFQIETSDPDPDVQTVSLISGSLPDGLAISRTGLISGIILPFVPVTGTPGFSVDGQGFDTTPFDFNAQSIDKNYQFTLSVSDGKEANIRTFDIYVYSRSSLTADNTNITSDNTFITADQSTIYTPLIVNAAPANIGTFRSDNFFAYQFVGLNFTSDPMEYLEYFFIGSSLPPGLTLDLNTGWLYGYIPDLGATQYTYNFAVVVRNANYSYAKSAPYYFSMTVIGQLSTEVTWLSPSKLGTIDNGSTSVFTIQAVNVAGKPLQYRLKPGDVYNKLPQGLSLLPSGDIAGRTSFNTFALDGGTTTFDSKRTSRLVIDPTTFDMTCAFTVETYSSDNLVSAYKTFTIIIKREYNQPYENLYIKAMPPQNDRQLIYQLIQNQDIIPASLLYRPSDPNFGVATSVIYQHAFGLTAATLDAYVASLSINHYWKNLTLGAIQTAQATDSAGNVIYEVVYSKIVDNLVNKYNQSVSKSILLPYPTSVDTVPVSTVYPNSLINMRNQVIDTVGQTSTLLPTWMLSKQADGQVLGFTPAWVICYTKPGKSGQIAYNIQQQFNRQLNKVDFKVDRYELDRLLTKNWDPVTHSWIPVPAETTFDLDPHYQLTGITAGTGYAIGDSILILGSVLGGVDSVNDVVVTVQDVSPTGQILVAYTTGQAALFTEGNTFTNISGTNIIGSGIGADFDFLVDSGTPTVFNGTSLRFEAPVDNYSNTTEYDKYLVFPRRNILV